MANIYPFPRRFNVTSSFAAHLRRNPPSKMPGTDYATPIGTPIYAPWTGYAKQENPAEMAGAITASITRNQPNDVGDKIYFVHLSKTEQLDRIVQRGELIGFSGNTGKTTGPHTHVSYRPIWNKRQYVDVEPMLNTMILKSEIQQPAPPQSNELEQKVAELEKARKELVEALQLEKQASAESLINKQLEISNLQLQLETLTEKIDQYTDADQKALIITNTSMEVSKQLSEKLADGGKYIIFAQPIGAFLGLVLARAMNVTGDELAIVTAGVTSLTNLALIVLNHFAKIF